MTRGLVILAIVLGACGGEPSQAPREAPAPPAAAPAPSAPASPRFDGLYRTEAQAWAGSTRVHWLRFYANGRVVEAMTGPESRPEEVAAWLDFGHPDARQRGRYELADGHVRIETQSDSSRHLAHGTLERDGIAIEWRDRTNDQRDTRRFRFAPIATWAAAAE